MSSYKTDTIYDIIRNIEEQSEANVEIHAVDVIDHVIGGSCSNLLREFLQKRKVFYGNIRLYGLIATKFMNIFSFDSLIESDDPGIRHVCQFI